MLPSRVENLPELLQLKGKLRLLLLVDPAMMGAANLETALQSQKLNFEEATNGRMSTSWKYRPFMFDTMPWQRYGPYSDGSYSWGPKFSWVQELCESIQAEDGPGYDFIQLVIDDTNWDRRDSTGNVWGYNLGWFFPNSRPDYQVEVIRAKKAWGWVGIKRTLDMELVHAFDQMALRIGVNFNTLFDVASFDNDVVHAADPRYPIFEYRHVYTRAVDTLIELFPFVGDDNMPVDQAKLNQIINELLLRNADAQDEHYLSRPEAEVRAEVGQLQERMNIIAVVGAARNVQPL